MGVSGWCMAANNLFTSYRTDNSSINTIIRVLLLHIDEPCSACSECGINFLSRTSWTAIIPLFFFSYLCCSAIPTSHVTIFMFLHTPLAGPKITLYFPHPYICVSPLIMCLLQHIPSLKTSAPYCIPENFRGCNISQKCFISF